MAFLTRRRILGLAGAGLLLMAASAGAHGPTRVPERTGPYDIRLQDPGGFSLPTYFHHGRFFVLGEEGQRYTIRISNPTSERVEAVLSVDGRDAISGEVASYRSGRGYIVPAYGSITVEGFRRSLGEVASFRFVDPQASYSARRGTPRNVGVVGVAIFREKVRRVRPAPPHPFPEEYRSRDDYGSAPAPTKGRAGASAPASRRADAAEEGERKAPRGYERHERPTRQLGTEYGETRQSSVVEVPFERRSRQPDALSTLHYDSATGLIARGIDLRGAGAPLFAGEPEAFPDSRFAPPPD